MLFHEFNVLSLPFLHLESLTHFDLNKTDTFFYNTCTFKTIDICALSLKIAKVWHRLFSINFGILLNGKTNMIKSSFFFWLSLPQYIKTKARYFLFNNFIYFSFLTATWARYFRIIMILSSISFTSAINKLLKLLCYWSSYL